MNVLHKQIRQDAQSPRLGDGRSVEKDKERPVQEPSLFLKVLGRIATGLLNSITQGIEDINGLGILAQQDVARKATPQHRLI